MSKFISSHSKIMLSLLSPKMPEMSKYTNEYSTNNTEDKQSKATSALSSQQIQEAVSHPDSIMQQIFRVTSEIQKALNEHNATLDEITQKREYIKSSLIKWQEMYGKIQEKKDDKISVQTGVKIKESIEALNKVLADLQPPEQTMQATRDKLNQEYAKLNDFVLEQKTKWHEHRELYFKKLEEELKNNEIMLTDLEKTELRQGNDNA